MHKHRQQTKAVICRLCCLLGTIALANSSISHATPRPALGQELDAASLVSLPKHVFADGEGLPEGNGDTVQGAELYANHCAACHGSQGQGGSALELVGDRSLLTSEFPDKGIAVYWPYAPTLFEYIQRAMPPEQPYSLSTDDVYAVIARLLELNGLVPSGQRVDAFFLSSLKMPNRNGFRSAYDSE